MRIQRRGKVCNISLYNIAFVNSECWLVKSRVDITLCQHGKFPVALNSNAYRPKCASYIIKKYKTFSVLIYSYINTRENWKNSKLCENTPPFGRRVSTQFLVFPISTRVDITVYINTENVLYFFNLMNYNKTEIYSINCSQPASCHDWPRDLLVSPHCVVVDVLLNSSKVKFSSLNITFIRFVSCVSSFVSQ